MPLKVYCGSFQPELEEAFLSSLTDDASRGRVPFQNMGRDSPFQHLGGGRVAVVTPSRRLADRLARLVALERGLSVLDVRFHTFHSLALEVLSSAGSAPEKLLTDGLFHDRIIDKALRGRGRRPSRGLAGAFRASVRDLLDAGIEPASFRDHLEGLVAREPDRSRLEEMLGLLEDYLGALASAGVLPPGGAARRAAEAVEEGRAACLDRYARFLYYGFYDLTGAQSEFFSAVASDCATEAYFPFRRDHPAFAFCRKIYELKLMSGAKPVHLQDKGEGRALGRTLECLFTPGRSAPAPAGALIIADASGESGEAWFVAKQILSLRVSFDEIGIVARTLEPYRSALRTALEENAIPFHMASAEPLLSHPVAKLCLLLLTLRRRDFPASAVIEILSSPYFSRERGLGPEWIALVGALGIHSGWLQWQGKLSACVRGGRELYPERVAEGGRGRFLSAETCARLWELLCSLRETLDWKGRSWGELSARAVALLKEHLEVRVDDPGRPAWEAVLGGIESLAAFDLAGAPAEEEFLDALEERLRQAALEPGPENAGVRVLGAMDARGESFRVLFLIGLHEGLFPRQVREDPLLSERVRVELRDAGGYWIHPKLEGHDEERLLFHLLVSSASERLYAVYQRSDEEGRARVPSVYLRDLCSAAGMSMETSVHSIPRQPLARLETVDRPLLSPKEASVLLARHGLRPKGFFKRLGIDERLLGWSLEHSESLARRGEPGELDGVIGLGGHFKRFRERGLSPSGLESFTRCPFQFFVSRVLGLTEAEEPAAREDFGSQLKGRLYHLVLKRFHERLIAAGFWSGRSNAWEGALEGAIEEVLLRTGFGELGLYPLLWESERTKMARHLRRLAGEDVLATREAGLAPDTLEAPCSTRVGGVKLYGRLDRVDRGTDGAFLVVDYKTSWPRSRPSLEKQVLAMRSHQPPIYIELLSAGGARSLGARFLVIEKDPSAERAAHQELTPETWERLRPKYLKNLAGLAGLIERGRFFITPDEDWGGACQYCGFSGICRKRHPPSRRRAETSKMRREHEMLLTLEGAP